MISLLSQNNCNSLSHNRLSSLLLLQRHYHPLRNLIVLLALRDTEETLKTIRVTESFAVFSCAAQFGDFSLFCFHNISFFRLAEKNVSFRRLCYSVLETYANYFNLMYNLHI